MFYAKVVTVNDGYCYSVSLPDGPRECNMLIETQDVGYYCAAFGKNAPYGVRLNECIEAERQHSVHVDAALDVDSS